MKNILRGEKRRRHEFRRNKNRSVGWVNEKKEDRRITKLERKDFGEWESRLKGAWKEIVEAFSISLDMRSQREVKWLEFISFLLFFSFMNISVFIPQTICFSQLFLSYLSLVFSVLCSQSRFYLTPKAFQIYSLITFSTLYSSW